MKPGDQRLESPQVEPAMSGPTLALVASTAVAVVSLVLAGLTGGPYLDFSSLNPWVAVFAVAAFAALISVSFAVERLLKAAHPERAEHWERAMLIWGAVATAALGSRRDADRGRGVLAREHADRRDVGCCW